MALIGRNFTVLWHGQFVSQLGNQASLIATTYYMLETTGSATLVAAAMIASTVPLVVLAPIGGTLADRHSRRAVLVVTDLLRAVAVAGLSMSVLWAPGATSRNVALIIAVAAFGGVMEALFGPAVQALIPELVPAHRLATANSVIRASRQTSVMAGQALGGVLYVAIGIVPLLLIDALSFAYAGVATWFLPADGVRPREPAPIRRVLYDYSVATREGMTYVWRRRGMTAVLGIFAGVNFLFMPIFVLLPFYTRQVIGGGADWYGFLLGGAGAGALLGSLAAGAVVSRVRAVATLVRVCVIGIACGVLVLAAANAAWVAFAAFSAIGALSSLINVIVITAFQSAVRSDVRGRVMALVITVSTAAVPLGMGLGGIMGELWGAWLPRVFAGCGLAIAMLIASSWWMRGISEIVDSLDVS
jgi:MFS family permease